MKSKAINFLLFLACLAVIVMILVQPAHATGQPQVDPVSSVASSTALSGSKSSSASSSAVDLSLMNSPTQTMREGNSYSLVNAGGAAPLPPGLCPKNDSRYISFLIFTYADSQTRTDMECLEKVLQMFRDTAPKPVAINYLADTKPVVTVPEAKPSESTRSAESSASCKPDHPRTAPKKHVKKPKACVK